MQVAFPALTTFFLTIFCLSAVPAHSLRAEQSDVRLEPVPFEEYPIYDRVVIDKFLTSQTELVLIERLTVTSPGPDWPSTNRALFEENNFFEGRLPPDLVTDFIKKNQQPSRLEGRFNFGVRYRFVSGQGEEPEVSLMQIPVAFPFSNVRGALTPSAGPQSAPLTIGLLGFSRVGFNVKRDQALVYVGDNREDGTGAGFLLWLSRRGQAWEIADTDVLWIARPSEER
jgi:hypothetical protein